MKNARTALGVGAAVAGALLLAAPSALAVEPQTATIGFDCGSFGSGEATLEATQDGTAATITITTDAITAPIPIGANSASSTLTLTKNGTDTVEFSGNSNPAIPVGAPANTGPLAGTVASGDSLEATSLTVSVLGITADCSATTPQNPGPFVFE
ncbi:hypothetical protein [Streptomyces phytophilus]|uniref:hypothetical protein n=1 Tax=Streptomyces phytophilus TaxID=722715 RepID=UPI0015EFE161|nr:hypothetical protein [Streptomyces phytophilus]